MHTFLAAMLVSLATASFGASDTTTVRIATFNIWELSLQKLDEVGPDGVGRHRQLRGAAEIIQRVRPDILLLNEIDYDAERHPAALFRDRYLKVAQNGQAPIDYPHVFAAPVNTGLPSGLDLNHDGATDGPDDAWGYGRYPGQYGMALLSRYPLDTNHVRTFQKLLWHQMPGNLLPDGRSGKPQWYTPEQAALLRLSSKSHWDIPVRILGTTVHLLCAHPTPPVFDGAEDRNGRRNFDEIRLWADYLRGGPSADYMVDDAGRRGPLPADAAVVILGDLNADPIKGDAAYGRTAISQLLDHPRLVDPKPARSRPGKTSTTGPAPSLERHTCDFGRIDYVLPSKNLSVAGGGVFWPASDDPLHALVAERTNASDHRLVWIDLGIPE